MSQVINFHELCTALALSVLLIMAECQNIDSIEYQNHGNIENFKDIEDQQQVNISNILENTRRNITAQLQNYNFTYSGVHQLEDLVLESGGQPLRSLIVFTWRSGSSFLAEIVNAMPGSFYNYEPFRTNGPNQIHRSSNVKMAQETIKNCFQCNYDDMEDFFEFDKLQLNPFVQANSRLWNQCKDNTGNDLCFDANFTATLCKLFPFLTMKLVRVRLLVVEDLLQDEELNLKLVFLIRDPRGVMRSRNNVNFCRPHPDCWEPEFLCADMISDYQAARRLLKKYPDRLMVLRFEELSLNPYETTQRLYEFLGLGMIPQVELFLNNHVNAEGSGRPGDNYSTYRVSSDVPFKWKYNLTYEYVEEIQLACQDAMDLWGYQMAYNASHMASKEFNPVGNYTF